MTPIKPWFTPHIDKEKDGYSVSVWNRQYSILKNSPLFSSILSSGKELLSAPMQIIAEENGEKCEFGDASVFVMEENDDEGITLLSTSESDTAVINVKHRIEFDGCDDISVTVMPRGLSVAQVFGIQEKNMKAFGIDKLYIDVPIRRENAEYYQVALPGGAITGKAKYVNNGIDTISSIIPEGGFWSSFRSQIYISGDKAGIGMFFADNKNFENLDEKRVFEIIDGTEERILRIHLLDQRPDCWNTTEAIANQAHNNFPISFRFGLQVTPVKPYAPSDSYERNMHLDCFKKIAGDYETFLSNPVIEGSDEIGFDRLSRLGVKVLYLHEKWNDIQNSPLLTKSSSERLKYIIEECHKRNIRVIPYFGYELSTLSPLWNAYSDEIMRKTDTQNFNHWYWYRQPPQRATAVCLQSQWFEIFYNGITKLQQEYGFDGFYFDTVLVPQSCCNQTHGCGFNKNGEIHLTYPVWAVRSFMKKIYTYAKAHNCTVNAHGYGSFNMGAFAFCDSLWEGEYFQSNLCKGTMTEMPEGLLRAEYTGRNIGVPVYALCYSNPPQWTFENSLGMMLLHGSMPKPVDIEKPLEIMSDIWKVYDNFPLDEAKWKPYYNPSSIIKCEGGAKLTAYETDDIILAICASDHLDFDAEVTITSSYKTIKDAVSGEVLCTNGILKKHIKGFDYLLLTAEKA